MKCYACLKQQRYEYGGYAVLPVQEHDIEDIRIWRNAQMDILRQNVPIERQQQVDYFNVNIWPTMALLQPRTILVSFFCQQQLIGYGGLVHIAWEHSRAEVSFLLAPDRATNENGYQADLAAFLSLMKHIAFKELKLNRLYTETYDIRPHHINVLESNGFLREGVLRHHVRIKGEAVNSIFHGCLNQHES